MRFDLNYICETMGNLSGIPVRIYEDSKELLFYSMVKLPKDPMIIHRKEILDIQEPISYYATNTLNYYGIFNIENKKIIIGPTRFVPNSQQELMDLAFLADISAEELPDFLTGMRAIVGLPLERLMQMLCLLHYLMTGEQTKMSEMIIHESQQETMEKNLLSSRINLVEDESSFYHKVDNTYFTESTLMDMIGSGDVAALEEWLRKPTTVQNGLCAANPIRQLKNTLISTATLASRRAILGGMAPADAIKLANDFIYKAELLNTSDAILNLQYHVIKTFAEQVHTLKHGTADSKLVMKVSNYIQQNLSSPVTVEEIADALYLSRPYLSKKFKAETGTSVSDFVQTQKIKAAKRLLKYTDKSLLAISIYLGFSSQSHFTRIFKKCTGTLPKAYREQAL